MDYQQEEGWWEEELLSEEELLEGSLTNPGPDQLSGLSESEITLLRAALAGESHDPLLYVII